MSALVGAVLASAAWFAGDLAHDAVERDAVAGIVDGYVTAIEAGDARTALAMTPAVAFDRGPLERGTPPETAAEVACGEPRIGDGLASVECEVEVPGASGAGRIVLERSGADDWTITTGLEVEVRPVSSSALVETIGGVEVERAVARGLRSVRLLPGIYDATIRTPELVPAERVEGVVVVPGGGELRWTGRPSPQLADDVGEAARAFMDECTRDRRDDCPEVSAGTGPFVVLDLEGFDDPDDPTALAYEVALGRTNVDRGVVTSDAATIVVQVDFGPELDRYEVSASSGIAAR